MANKVVRLVTDSDIGADDDVYVYQGDEINLENRKTLGLWVKFTVSDSTTNEIQLDFRHTSGDTTVYTLPTAGDYQKTLGDANINVYYEFTLNNAIPYVRVKSKAGDVDTGGGTIGTLTIDYTLG